MIKLGVRGNDDEKEQGVGEGRSGEGSEKERITGRKRKKGRKEGRREEGVNE